MTYLLFTLGLIGLFVGGESLVRGAAALARRFGLSPMLIGLTIVGFGTSTPELLVSVQAALGGAPAIAIGNVMGSNAANILLILGVAAVVTPIHISLAQSRNDLGFMLLATAGLALTLWGGEVSRLEGAALVGGMLLFLYTSFRHSPAPAGAAEDEDGVTAPEPPPLIRSLLITLGGLVILMVGARLLVDSATDIARTFGISEAVIGLTIVAIGTSLPELATSLIAAWRKKIDIAVGNTVGSNVFNIFGILGITALIAPIPAEARFLTADMPWVAGSALALVVAAAPTPPPRA
ncbi:MAG: calcium/sodium antiporter, partial [Rhodobacterales bacterium]|nr:calcium/sodium antiporter [Rhodobacterales bacterium]